MGLLLRRSTVVAVCVEAQNINLARQEPEPDNDTAIAALITALTLSFGCTCTRYAKVFTRKTTAKVFTQSRLDIWIYLLRHDASYRQSRRGSTRSAAAACTTAQRALEQVAVIEAVSANFRKQTCSFEFLRPVELHVDQATVAATRGGFRRSGAGAVARRSRGW